jgi:hypothetical protein
MKVVLNAEFVLLTTTLSTASNDLPNPTRYKSLTQGNLDHTKHLCGKVIVAISINNTSTLSMSLSSNEPVMHLVAAILGMLRNPIAYVAPNASSILELTSDSDMSGGSFISDLIPAIGSITTVPLKEAAPLHIPHLY